MRNKTIPIESLQEKLLPVSGGYTYKGNDVPMLIENPNKVYTFDLSASELVEDKFLWNGKHVRLVDTDKYVYKKKGWKSNLVVFDDSGAYPLINFKTPIFTEAVVKPIEIKMYGLNPYVFVVTDLMDFVILDAHKIPAVYVTIHTYRKLKAIPNREYIVSSKFSSGLYNEILGTLERTKGVKMKVLRDAPKFLSDLVLGKGVEKYIAIYGEFENLAKNIAVRVGNHDDDNMVNKKVLINADKERMGYYIKQPKGEPFYFTNFLIEPVVIEVDLDGREKALYNIYLSNFSILSNIYIDADAWVSIDRFKKTIYTLSPNAQVKLNGKTNGTALLEELRNYIYQNYNRHVGSTRKVPKMGYYLDYGASIYPDWTSNPYTGSSIFSSTGKFIDKNELDFVDPASNPIFDIFRVDNSSKAPYPKLIKISSKTPDADFFKITSKLMDSLGYCEGSSSNKCVTGPMLFGWALGSFFLPFIMRDFGKYPQFNIFGSAKTGKTMASILLSNSFGIPSIKLSPTTTSIAGFTRLINTYTNGFMVLDEFTRKSMPNEKVYDAFVSVLRSNYDGSSRILGSKSDSTSYTQVQTGIPSLLLGESAIEDNALRSRSLCMQIERPERIGNDPQYADSIMAASFELQPYFKYFIESISESEWFVWKERINVLRNYLKTNVKKLDQRELDVWSIVLAFSFYLFPNVKEYQEFIKIAVENTKRSVEFDKGEDIFTILDNFVMYASSDFGKTDLFKKNMKVWQGDDGRVKIGFHMKNVYNTALLYEKNFNIRNVTIGSAAGAISILKKKSYFDRVKTVRGYIEGQIFRAYVIDASALPLSLMQDILSLHPYANDGEVLEAVYRKSHKIEFNTNYSSTVDELSEDQEITMDTPVEAIDTSFLDEDDEDLGDVDGNVELPEMPKQTARELFNDGLLEIPKQRNRGPDLKPKKPRNLKEKPLTELEQKQLDKMIDDLL